jgi:hypothetical protein
MEDLVICPICNKKFKELNTAHLSSHGLNAQSFKEKFPDFDRLSKSVRLKKATLKNMSVETQKRLKKSHTLEGFIERYGSIDGTFRYNESKRKKSKSHSLDFYIEKYGELEGKEKHANDNKNRGVTLEKYIKKYGESEGVIKYKNWLSYQKYTNSIEFYIEKYGEAKGTNVFYEKHKLASDKKRRVHKDLIPAYNLYCSEVNTYTRRSLKNNKLENLHLRGKQHGYHLDHKISMCYGFKNNINPEIIGSIHNLQIITISENCSKQDDCIDLEIVLEKFNKKTI